MTTEADPIILAYLAGVIDSDGSITIAVDTWRTTAKGYAPCYSENITLGQCDRQAVDLLQEVFGGEIRTEKPRSEFRRPMFFWCAADRSAVIVARALLPYLRIKRRQADLVLALRAIKERGRDMNSYLEETVRIRRTRWGDRPYRRQVLKPEVIAEYDALVSAVRALNDTRHTWPRT